MGTGPAPPHALQCAALDRADEGCEVFEARADQDQAAFHRPLLEVEQAQHGFLVEGVAAEAVNRFGRIGDDAAGFDAAFGAGQLPAVHGI
jgi:hypothetical protein